MTELEIKIWKTIHNWCDTQLNEIPDQNRRYLMDKINALVLSHVSNWIEFDEVKPDVGKLFLITNNSFVEIAYYEDGEIIKPWRYDKYDIATLKAQKKGLKYQYINLPYFS